MSGQRSGQATYFLDNFDVKLVGDEDHINQVRMLVGSAVPRRPEAQKNPTLTQVFKVGERVRRVDSRESEGTVVDVATNGGHYPVIVEWDTGHVSASEPGPLEHAPRRSEAQHHEDCPWLPGDAAAFCTCAGREPVDPNACYNDGWRDAVKAIAKHLEVETGDPFEMRARARRVRERFMSVAEGPSGRTPRKWPPSAELEASGDEAGGGCGPINGVCCWGCKSVVPEAETICQAGVGTRCKDRHACEQRRAAAQPKLRPADACGEPCEESNQPLCPVCAFSVGHAVTVKTLGYVVGHDPTNLRAREVKLAAARVMFDVEDLEDCETEEGARQRRAAAKPGGG